MDKLDNMLSYVCSVIPFHIMVYVTYHILWMIFAIIISLMILFDRPKKKNLQPFFMCKRIYSKAKNVYVVCLISCRDMCFLVRWVKIKLKNILSILHTEFLQMESVELCVMESGHWSSPGQDDQTGRGAGCVYMCVCMCVPG